MTTQAVDVLDLFQNAEQNLLKKADGSKLEHMKRLDDMSDATHFSVLMRLTALDDPLQWRARDRPPLGSQWRHRLADGWNEALQPLLQDCDRAVMSSLRTWRPCSALQQQAVNAHHPIHPLDVDRSGALGLPAPREKADSPRGVTSAAQI